MYTPFYLTNINFVQYPALDSLLLGVGERLTEWFAQEDYLDQLALPFSATAGTKSWEANAQALRQSILGGNYSVRLEVRSNAELKGALGAYSATGTTNERTIYLNGDWLATASEEQIQAVLLEELGHDFDQYLNSGADSTGDEGAIFAQLALGNPLDSAQFTENDSGTIVVDGTEVAVEKADISFGNSSGTSFNSFEIKNDQPWAQSFNISGSGQYDISQVSLWLRRDVGAGGIDLTVSIRSGSFNGSTLWSQVFGASQINNSASSDISAFDEEVFNVTLLNALNKGTTYYLRLDSNSAVGKVF